MSECLSTHYGVLLGGLKTRIRAARVKAALAANAELISLYWDIGRMIVEQQEKEGWGKSIVEQISKDLRAEFPDQKGLSPQNLWFMRSFYLEWYQSFTILQPPAGEIETSSSKILKQPVGEIERLANLAQPFQELQVPEDLLRIVREIPWGQNIDLITRIKDPHQRLWYARKTIENGWSRAVLEAQIESRLHERQGAALTNTSGPQPNKRPSKICHETSTHEKNPGTDRKRNQQRDYPIRKGIHGARAA